MCTSIYDLKLPCSTSVINYKMSYLVGIAIAHEGLCRLSEDHRKMFIIISVKVMH